MAGINDSKELSNPERRSWGKKIGDFLGELLEIPDEPEALLLFVGVVVVILLISVISTAFETWTNPPSRLLG